VDARNKSAHDGECCIVLDRKEHIEIIAAKLAALHAGKIRRLIINMPSMHKMEPSLNRF
jgi:hypothetical protein